MNSNGAFLTNATYPPDLVDAGAQIVRLDAMSFPNVRPNAGNDPTTWNVAHGAFVSTIVTNYKTLTTNWESWNEPDLE